MKKELSVPIIYLAEIDSTSNYLKAQCKETHLDEFTTVVTDFQDSGHGQANNSWESERGKNLLFSFVFYPEFCPARQQFYLSQLIALAIKDTLDCFCSGFSVKWPNDIYWEDQKICGILIENELCGETIQQCIAGIGININQCVFRSDAPNPVALIQIINEEKDRGEILHQIMDKVLDYYRLLKEGGTSIIVHRYIHSLYRKNSFHRYKDAEGIFSARIADILPQGALVLEDKAGKRRTYHFKEVSFLPD